jgi:hypothetical protein
MFRGVALLRGIESSRAWRRGQCLWLAHEAYAAFAESSEPMRNKRAGEPLPGVARVGGIFKASSARGIVKRAGSRERGLKVGIPKGTPFGARVWGGVRQKISLLAK